MFPSAPSNFAPELQINLNSFLQIFIKRRKDLTNKEDHIRTTATTQIKTLFDLIIAKNPNKQTQISSWLHKKRTIEGEQESFALIEYISAHPHFYRKKNPLLEIFQQYFTSNDLLFYAAKQLSDELLEDVLQGSYGTNFQIDAEFDLDRYTGNETPV